MSQPDILSQQEFPPLLPLAPVGPQLRMFSPPNRNVHLSSAQSDLCSGEPKQELSGNKKQEKKKVNKTKQYFFPVKQNDFNLLGNQQSTCIQIHTHQQYPESFNKELASSGHYDDT